MILIRLGSKVITLRKRRNGYVPPPGGTHFSLLLEDGSALLLEDGNKLLLEA